MLTRPSRFTLAIIVLGGVGLHSAAGQIPSNDRREKIRSDVQRISIGGKSAVVKMKDGTTKRGRIVRVDMDSFDLAESPSGQVSTINYDDVLKVKRAGMSTGAKTAIWVGVAVGAAALIVTLPKRTVIGPICPLGCGL